MRDVRSLLLVACILLAAGAFPACSCEDNGQMGRQDLAGLDLSASAGDLAGAMVMPSTDGGCGIAGANCASGAACCSGSCDPSMHVCTIPQCAPVNAQCKVATDCCNLNCSSGLCTAGQCVSDNQPCTPGGASCCSTQCVNGSCKPLNTQCLTAGNACGTGTDGGTLQCCGKLCTNGTCAAPSQVSYCTQPGDICQHDNECCTGVCTIPNGGSVGTCANIAVKCGPNANGGVDGTVCKGCQGCCSSYCQPFGTGGSHICQPASGCHVLGDLCLKNTDCCGGDAMSGLPGAGLVICTAVPGFPQIGTCSMANPNNCSGEPTCKNTCQPEGDICHNKDVMCSSNSFPANCCSAPGASSGVCLPDKLGVPRCFGLAPGDGGAMGCQGTGQACASSADCCGGLPCLPNASGHLVCGSVSCVPGGGTCTTTADCCTGFACSVPAGSTSGTCVNPTPPPPQPVDGGATDLASPPPSCALSGQSCTAGGAPACCGAGQCIGPTGAACGASETDCICSSPII
jgi:hypothetical protein